MSESVYVSEETLLEGLETIRNSPKDRGTLEMIVVRPEENERLVLETCFLSAAEGAHGDLWSEDRSALRPGETLNPDIQITIMNSRCIALLAQEKSRWALAGDQLYIDMDLSDENLPPGTRLAVGSAVLETTSVPHTGCDAFLERFGRPAVLFVNSPTGKRLHLRGIYAKVVQDGVVKQGDTVSKV